MVLASLQDSDGLKIRSKFREEEEGKRRKKKLAQSPSLFIPYSPVCTSRFIVILK